MSEQPPSINEWRHDGERAELVERIISLTQRANLAERTIRELTEAASGDQSLGSYIEALQARIIVLEGNVERLSRRSKGQAA